MHHAEAEIPLTRIYEFKSLREEAYTPENQNMFQKYQELAEKTPNLIFGGRLGCYKYWDMDKAILNALECFENKIEKLK